MKRCLPAACVALILIVVAMVGTSQSFTLNPYEPHNAVAAEPMTPYNLDCIPQCSRTFYLPCPSSVPYADQLPNLPPLRQAFSGPFDIPVPVP